MPTLAETDDEIARCFDVMVELRPHLQRAAFVSQVRNMQAEGFRLAYLEENAEVACVAGFRIATNLAFGRHLYIDDLVTAERARSRGLGDIMLAWLRALAVDQGCRVLNLDSGTQRQQAHKFYFRHGLVIAAFHFYQPLPEGTA